MNVIGAFFGLKHVSRAMVESGGGVIINTASLAGLLGPRYMAVYAASKHAVIGMTKSAAKDLAPHGVRVCAVAPGLLEGRMWTTQVEGKARCALLDNTGMSLSLTHLRKGMMILGSSAHKPRSTLTHSITGPPAAQECHLSLGHQTINNNIPLRRVSLFLR